MWRVFLTAAVLAASAAAPARAAFIIMVDEFGNGIGTRGSGFFANDPGPGGLPNVLTYNLPFAGVQGDVLIVDTPGTPPLDVIRFNGDGTLIFYSDNVDGFDAPGDTPSPPGAIYTNVATIFEAGPEGNAIAVYTPLQGQPGFVADGVAYTFVSDGVVGVPVPPAAVMAATGALLCLGAARRRGRALVA